ncbi:hypothetical protein [Pyrococcus sp. ST04]|uniref:hypothetical protein n=1 Tax=Pyrococcus sp. ST04 TaxID=1183377 RepID=UPI00064F1C62|nr:hypothetical protein [Pyrococcus sp. ST04]
MRKTVYLGLILILIIILPQASAISLKCQENQTLDLIVCTISDASPQKVEVNIIAVNGYPVDWGVFVVEDDGKIVYTNTVKIPGRIAFDPKSILRDVQREIVGNSFSFECMLCDKVNYFTFKIGNSTTTVRIFIKRWGDNSFENFVLTLIFILALISSLIYGGVLKFVKKRSKREVITGAIRAFLVVVGLFFGYINSFMSSLIFYMLGSSEHMVSDYILSSLIFVLVFFMAMMVVTKGGDVRFEIPKKKEIMLSEGLLVLYGIMLFLNKNIENDVIVFSTIVIGVLVYSYKKLEDEISLVIGHMVFLAWSLFLYTINPSLQVFGTYLLATISFVLLSNKLTSTVEESVLVFTSPQRERKSVLGPPPTAKEIIEKFERALRE